MKPMRATWFALLLGTLLILIESAARADQVWTVTVDTTKMAADYTGPFALDFELIGSSGNTATLTDFSFGGGGSGPASPFLTGGASGDLGGTVTLTDSSSFFNDFNQQFTPGATLTFTLDSTLVAPPSGGSPDNFSMVMFSNYDPTNGYNPSTGTGGTPIPTTDPSGNDTFFNFNITGPGQPTVSSFPSMSGDITITITPAGVPEPSSVVMMLLGMMGVGGAVCWRRAGAGHRGHRTDGCADELSRKPLHRAMPGPRADAAADVGAAELATAANFPSRDHLASTWFDARDRMEYTNGQSCQPMTTGATMTTGQTT